MDLPAVIATTATIAAAMKVTTTHRRPPPERVGADSNIVNLLRIRTALPDERLSLVLMDHGVRGSSLDSIGAQLCQASNTSWGTREELPPPRGDECELQ